jgi:nucleoside 2-deoxyribosyltransferase
MNCFVVMPFSSEFDDVYSVIKQSVERAVNDKSVRCLRLDELRPAGRITDRLLNELRMATFCVADLTGCKPNVMWEVGFAMALSRPIILVTQSLQELPFDIKDMQSIEYHRDHLSSTLGASLHRMVVDTMAEITQNGFGKESEKENSPEIVGKLLEEVKQLKEMLFEFVTVKNNGKEFIPSASELQSLSGSWFDSVSGSNIYVRVIRGELIAPYSYSGDDKLNSVYYDWRRIGEYWFARFEWLDRSYSGFTFLKRETVDDFIGAYWLSELESRDIPDKPPTFEGIPSNLERRTNKETPNWAEQFFQDVEREGLQSYFENYRKFKE